MSRTYMPASTHPSIKVHMVFVENVLAVLFPFFQFRCRNAHPSEWLDISLQQWLSPWLYSANMALVKKKTVKITALDPSDVDQWVDVLLTLRIQLDVIHVEEHSSIRVWHWVIILLVVNPGSAQVCFPVLTVHDDCLFNQLPVFGFADVTTNPFLFPAHVKSHMSTHLSPDGTWQELPVCAEPKH